MFEAIMMATTWELLPKQQRFKNFDLPSGKDSFNYD